MRTGAVDGPKNIQDDDEAQPFTMTLRRRLAKEQKPHGHTRKTLDSGHHLPASSPPTASLELTYSSASRSSPQLLPTMTTRSRSSSTSSTLSDLYYTPEEETILLASIHQPKDEHKLSYHGREVPAHWVPPLNPLSKKIYASMDRNLYQEPEVNVKTWQERVREYDEICKEKQKMERERGFILKDGKRETAKVSSILELRRRILGKRGNDAVQISTIAEGIIRLGEIAYPSPPDSLSEAELPTVYEANDRGVREASIKDYTMREETSSPQSSIQPPDGTIVALSLTLHLSYTTPSTSLTIPPSVYHIVSSTINVPINLKRITLHAIHNILYSLLLPSDSSNSLRAHFLKDLGLEDDEKDWWSAPLLKVGFGDRMCEETIGDDARLRDALGRVLDVGGQACYLRAEWKKKGFRRSADLG